MKFTNNDTKQESIELSSASYEYSRYLYSEVLGWYKNADAKAQVILTLDGAFITFFSSALFFKSNVISTLDISTKIILCLMGVSLTFSIYNAISCLWSRIYSTHYLKDIFKKAGVEPNDITTYKPEVMWFFQMIPQLNRSYFVTKILTISEKFEPQALMNSVYTLCNNVVKKHKHVNWGFLFAAITWLLFLISAITNIYLLK